MKHVLLCSIIALAGCIGDAAPDEGQVPEGRPTTVSDLKALTARLDKSLWPSAVPRNGYIATPAGFVHEDCLHQLGVGDSVETVGETRVIHRADGSTETRDVCAHPWFDQRGALHQLGEALPVTLHAKGTNQPPPTAQPEISNGYSFKIDKYDGTDVGYLRSAWTVPGASTAGSGAIQFTIWNGVQGVYDLWQPILYNTGGSAWSFYASIFEGSCGCGFVGPTYSMSSGQQVQAATSHLSTGPHSETLSYWTGAAWRILGSSSFSDVDTVADDAIFGASETYYATSCSQYPAPITFTGEQFSRFLYCTGGPGCAMTAPSSSSMTLALCVENQCNSLCSTAGTTAYEWQWHQ